MSYNTQERIERLKESYKRELSDLNKRLRYLENEKNEEIKENNRNIKTLNTKKSRLMKGLILTLPLAVLSGVATTTIGPIFLLGCLPIIVNLGCLENNTYLKTAENKQHKKVMKKTKLEEMNLKDEEEEKLNKLAEIRLLEIQKRQLMKDSMQPSNNIVKPNFVELQKINRALEQRIPMESKTVYIKVPTKAKTE